MLERRNKPQVSKDDRTRNRLKALIAVGIVSTNICLGGCSSPSSMDDGTKPETPSPFSGTYRLTADGLSIGTVEFQGSEYTLVIGDGERKADGEYTYTPETQKLVLHDRATGVTATWNSADFRTFESVQPRSVSNLRTQSNELLTNQAGIAQSTIVPQGCGDENANLLSPTCTLTASPSSTVAPGGIELISENAPLLIASSDADKRCFLLFQNGTQVSIIARPGFRTGTFTNQYGTKINLFNHTGCPDRSYARIGDLPLGCDMYTSDVPLTSHYCGCKRTAQGLSCHDYGR